MKPINFENQVAIVTGAEQGIGRQYALDLAKRGACVVVNDIGCDSQNIHTADRVVEQIKSMGKKAVANYDSVATMAGGQNIRVFFLKKSQKE